VCEGCNLRRTDHEFRNGARECINCQAKKNGREPA
jgi:hypothetical protein